MARLGTYDPMAAAVFPVVNTVIISNPPVTYGPTGVEYSPTFDLVADRSEQQAIGYEEGYDIGYDVGEAYATGQFADWETIRNTPPNLDLIPSEETGGPAPWLYKGDSQEGTLDLNQVLLDFEEGRNTPVDPNKMLDDETITQFGEEVMGLFNKDTYALSVEALRNTLLQNNEVAAGVPIRQFGEDRIGTAPALGEAPSKPLGGLAADRGDGTLRITWTNKDAYEETDMIVAFTTTGLVIAAEYAKEGLMISIGLGDQLQTILLLPIRTSSSFGTTSDPFPGKATKPSPPPPTPSSETVEDSIATGRLLSMLRQKAVYWAPARSDDYGKPIVAPPILIACRWEDVAEEFIDDQGTKHTSVAKVYVDRDLVIGGVIKLGMIRDLTNPIQPKLNSGAFEVRRLSKLPNKKASKHLRVVYL